jgi:hypothetical protein
VGKPDGKRAFGKPVRRWKDNIKMYLPEMGHLETVEVHTGFCGET